MLCSTATRGIDRGISANAAAVMCGVSKYSRKK
jgi:hypothetical protein